MDIVCKNTGKIYEEFELDLWLSFFKPSSGMDLILKISNTKIGLITDVDQQLFVERSMRGGYVFHGDRILETNQTGPHTGEKPNVVFLDMNSLYLSAMSHFSLPWGHYTGLDYPSKPNLPDITSIEENGPQGLFFEIDGKIPRELHDSGKGLCFLVHK